MPIVNSSMFFEKLSGVWKLSVFLILFSMLHVYLKNLRRVFEGKKRKPKAAIYTVGACSVQKNVKISSGWHSAQFSRYLNRSYSLKGSHQRHSKKHLFGFKNNRSFRIFCQLFTHRSEVKSFPCSVLPDNLNHQGSTHGWLFRTPHTEMPPFPCAAEVWGHPGRRAACIPNMPHRNCFLGMIPAQHWCPWSGTFIRRSENTNTLLTTWPSLCGSHKRALTYLFSLKYMASYKHNATKTSQPNAWRDFWLSKIKFYYQHNR